MRIILGGAIAVGLFAAGVAGIFFGFDAAEPYALLLAVVGATMIGETNDSGLYYNLVSTRSIFPGKELLNGNANYAQTQFRLTT